MALGFSATTDYSGWLNSSDICSYYASWRASGPNTVTFQAGSTGSSPSTPQQSSGALTTSWQRFYYTLLVPSNTKTIVCGLYSEATVLAGGIEVVGAQFELGTVPTPFERRHVQHELTMAQRYFEVIDGADGFPSPGEQLVGVGYVHTTSRILGHVHFHTKKRIVPAVTFVGTSANIQCLNPGNWYSNNSISGRASTRSMRLDINFAAGYFTAGNACEMRISDTNTKIWIDSEI
jgi:hypothetical protein